MTPIYLNVPTRRETKDSLIFRSSSENYVQEMKIATSQTLQHLCSCLSTNLKDKLLSYNSIKHRLETNKHLAIIFIFRI